MRVLIAYDASACADAAIDDLRRAGLGPSVEAMVITAADVLPALEGGPYNELMSRLAITSLREGMKTSDAFIEARWRALSGAQRVHNQFQNWIVRSEPSLSSPCSAVIHAAEAFDADLIVVGSHHRTVLGRLVAGSVSRQIAAAAPCSVRIGWAHPDRAEGPVRITLVADGSPGASLALRAVAERQWPQGSEVRVTVPAGIQRATTNEARLALAEEAASELRGHDLKAEVALLPGEGANALLHDTQQWGSHCVFIAANGEGKQHGNVLDRLADQVLTHANCSVEIARAAPRTERPRATAGVAGLVLLLCLTMLSAGCSIRQYAIHELGDSLAEASGTFASDNDPELIRQAVPANLKIIEGLLQESPNHEGLLLAAASGFTQYSYAFVQEDADELEPHNLAAATAMRLRARNLYLRARDYGLRGLDARHRGCSQKLRDDPASAVLQTDQKDVPLLYWTAAAWGLAISLSKDDPDLIADRPSVEALINRALELEPSFGGGAIQCFLITYEMSRQGTHADAEARARGYFEEAVRLARGQSATPFVTFAEAVSVQRQNRAEFKSLLKQALEVDVNARPPWRLMNLIMQRRARWLLSRTDELFVE